MNPNTYLVITSISHPNKVLQDYAKGCLERNMPFIMIGDSKSPADFQLEGCDFYSLERQRGLDFAMAPITPERHYTRKNLGYLLAALQGAEIIVETDDDNFAMPSFWEERKTEQPLRLIENGGWVNVYKYFSDENIWPRGFLLDELHKPLQPLDQFPNKTIHCPIQQGLANENPDVDAIYRLTLPLPVNFRDGESVALGRGSWCPFNSQNTTWYREAFMLMYLPAFCSFRMTDIWRSFVTQRIAWENGWPLLFHNATVWQERNEHNLMRDFADEITGYLHNRAICEALEKLPIQPGVDKLGENLILCYEELVRNKWVGEAELPLVLAWVQDMTAILKRGESTAAAAHDHKS